MTLNDEQRTRIRRPCSRRDIPRVDHVDFSVNVGTEVPTSVRIVEVPPTLIEIYPEWQGDQYFVESDDIVIVDHSRKIVAVVPVGSSSASTETRSTTTTVSSGGPDIVQVQQILIEKGYYHGRADGKMGRDTREALIAFQRKEGINATGEIDERTTTALGVSGHTEGNAGRNGASSTSGQAGDNAGSRNGANENRSNANDNDRNKAGQNSRPAQRPSTSARAAGRRTRTKRRIRTPTSRRPVRHRKVSPPAGVTVPQANRTGAISVSKPADCCDARRAPLRRGPFVCGFNASGPIETLSGSRAEHPDHGGCQQGQNPPPRW